MEKPEPIKMKPALDYSDIIKYIEEKYNIKVTDYLGHFSEKPFLKTKEKYGDDVWYTTEPKYLTSIQKEAADYYKTLKIEFDKLEYLNYWQWLRKSLLTGISHGSTKTWCITHLLESDETPAWVKEITQLIYDEFKEYLDEDGRLNIIIKWI